MKRIFAGIMVMIGFGCLARAGDVKETGRFNLASVPRLTTAPKIDGVVGKIEWYGATLMPRLINAADGSVDTQRSRVYIAYDDKNLYVAFQIDRPPNAITPAESDTVALLLDPAHEHKAPTTFSGNVARTVAGEGWQYNARSTDFGWEGEMAIPFSTLRRSTPRNGEVWGLDFVNEQHTPITQVSALGFIVNRSTASEFGHVVFSESGPVVRFRESGTFFSENGGGISIEIVNATDAPVQPVVSLDLLKRRAGAQGGPTTYLKGIAQAGATENADIVRPAADLTAMIQEHLARYAPIEDAQAKAAQTVTMGPQQRTEIRVTQNEPSDYLGRYLVRVGDRVLADGVVPFTLSSPMRVTSRPFFLSPKVLEVTADLRRVPEWQTGAKLKFAIAKKAGDKPLVSAERQFKASPMVVEQLPTASLIPGGYQLTTELLGTDGARKAFVSEGFSKPEDPQWLTNPFTPGQTVPPPWIPIQATEKRVSFLMGDYELARSTWPQQIRTRSVYEEKRVPILRAPMMLKGRVNGKEIAWEKSKGRTKRKKKNEVEIEGDQQFENVAVHSSVTFEYDGMARVALDLAPQSNGAKPAIDALWLEVPLTPEVSKLFHYAPNAKGKMEGPRMAGGLRPDDALKFEFIYSIWLGNEERGFRWFAENWKGWHLDKDAAGQALEVINSPQGATLRVNFFKAAQPFVLTRPRQIVFGYEFTPARTLPHRMFFQAAFSDFLPREQAVGVNVVENWYYKFQGWPEIYNADELKQKLKDLKYSHDHGIAMVPYSGWYIARDSDVYKAFGAEMVTEPLANAGCGCDQCCWNTSITDAYPTLLADRARDSKIDGYRMDAGFSAESCESLIHRGYGSTCGWVDDDGKLQPSRGIFAARKAAQRTYWAFHGGVQTNGWCLHHIHQGNRYDAILSHQDAVTSAEGPELWMTKLSDFPLDFYRAFVMGDAHGYRVIYFPKSEKFGIDSRYGIALLHNLIPRGSGAMYQREVSNSRSAFSPAGIWRALMWIDTLDMPRTEFWGYWKNSAFLNTGDQQLVGTFYVRRGGKLLLALLNLHREPAERTIRIDFAKLGFGKQLYARDANTFDEIPVTDNAVTLTFTAEGYRLIEFAPQPIDPWTPEKISGNLIPEFKPGAWDEKAVTAGWYARAPTNGVHAAGNEIIVESDGKQELNWTKMLTTAKKGQHFLLEAEARVDGGDDVNMSADPTASFFEVALGEVYDRHARTLNTKSLPGRHEKIRLWCTMAEEQTKVQLRMRGKGRIVIRNLEVYEVKNAPLRPGYAP